MIGFEEFQNDVFTSGQNNAVPVRPSQNMAILKHDARDGSLKILLPNDANGDRRDDIHVKEVEFVALPMMGKVAGENIGSNVTLSNLYDVYSYGKFGKSFGIMTGSGLFNSTNQELNSARARVVRRLFGVLRSVNGSGPANNEDLADVFGDTAIGCYIDLPYKKYEPLQSAVSAMPNATSGSISGLLVKLSGSKKKEYSYQVTTNLGDTKTNYLPVWEVNELPAESKQKFAEYAQDFLKEFSKWRNDVKKNDAFLGMVAGRVSMDPGTVDKLRDLDVTWENYEEKVAEYATQDLDGWQAIRAQVLNGGQQPAAQNAPAFGGTAPSGQNDQPLETNQNIFDQNAAPSLEDVPF